MFTIFAAAPKKILIWNWRPTGFSKTNDLGIDYMHTARKLGLKLTKKGEAQEYN
jgi:hypothetical protein